MYKYHKPTPIVVKLNDDFGFSVRERAAIHLKNNINKKGAERGKVNQQGFGLLAEMVIRSLINMPEINNENHPLAYDILLPTGVKLDIKCRGGSLPFREEYESDDGINREAKHNFFARQIYDDSLDTDIYLMSHLETPKKDELPGTKRQKKWILYICGWVSKKRVIREGVYLPRKSITERGNEWFCYRGQEIEYYHRNLNGLQNLKDILKIDKNDVLDDGNKVGDLNMTSVDAIRACYDLMGRGVLEKEALDYVKSRVKIEKNVKPILSINQYYHLLGWLKENGKATEVEVKKLQKLFPEIDYTGI
ncbi:MAG: hypothetical protein AAB881_01500 [Patescibacteria group bacterium]